MSHFAFLSPEWPDIAADACRAEEMAKLDPRGACFYARRTLELIVRWIYQNDTSLRAPYAGNLGAMIFEPGFKTLVGNALLGKAKVIKELGNRAVHGAKVVRDVDAIVAVRELFHLCFWLARTYEQGAKPSDDLAFDEGVLPTPAGTKAQTAADLEALERSLAERDERLAEALAAKAGAEAELAAQRAVVAAAKARNAAVPDAHDYSEAETRRALIDVLLAEAGWPLDQPRDREFPVKGMPNTKGEGFVDYVLWGTDGKPLAVVEAKRTTKSPQAGKQQAKLYADCLEAQFGQRPVIFCTNGYEHFVWDDQSYAPRDVQGFFTRDELQLLIQRRGDRKPLASAKIDAAIVERPYQHRAIRRICEAFAGKERKALVVMATGAGKTRTVIALVDLLMRAGWVRRVLVLADRTALVNQAVKAFKTHLPTAAPVNLVTERQAQGRIYVSTYPTMMGLIEETQNGVRRFGPGYFDLVVIDEAHRSVYQKYRAIFAWFDSLLVGLTATPKDDIDHNTYSLFDLETGVPTDAYDLDEAVKDGYLVPPRAVSVPLRFQREGIRYDDLSEEEKARWDRLDWEGGAVPDQIEAAALNRWLFNEDTVDKVLAHLMTRGLKVAGGDRLGKTIIFAKNHEHAEFIARRFDANYPEYKGEFARVIDFQVNYAQSLIDAFSSAEKSPHIAISVDMLDTGIDVPEVVNLVFFKAVRSKTKFWQMVGRGTRLRPDLFGPGQPKTFFYLFDYCENLEFFSQDPERTEGKAGEPLSQKIFRKRLELLLALDAQIADAVREGRPTPERALRNTIAAQLRDVVASMNVENFIVRPHRPLVEVWSRGESWQHVTPLGAADLGKYLGPLPTTLPEEDEEAKRFDNMILALQVAAVRGEARVATLQEPVKAIASSLAEMTNIPLVKAQESTIRDLLQESWWQRADAAQLEVVRVGLRGLAALIEKTKRHILYSDFEDELGAETHVLLPGLAVGFDMERFKEKVRAFLLQYQTSPALRKVRMNGRLSRADIAELERLLASSGVAAPEEIAKAEEEAHGLGLLIRSLVGLDRSAAQAALAGFTASRTLNSRQLEFVDLLIEHLTAGGVVDAGLLYESPFTDIHALGVDGVFMAKDAAELIAILDEVRGRAVA